MRTCNATKNIERVSRGIRKERKRERERERETKIERETRSA